MRKVIVTDPEIESEILAHAPVCLRKAADLVHLRGVISVAVSRPDGVSDVVDEIGAGAVGDIRRFRIVAPAAVAANGEAEFQGLLTGVLRVLLIEVVGSTL